MSEIKTDKLTGVGSTGVDIRVKNTSVYESANSTGVTQNIVESVLKHWTIVDQIGTTESLGSFNQSSLVDTAVGRTNFTFINNFSSINKCTTMANSYTIGGWYEIGTTSGYRITNYYASAYTDMAHCSSKISGDLA
jgi:hypothetical protein